MAKLTPAQSEALQAVREIEDNVRWEDRLFPYLRPRKATLFGLFKLGLLQVQQVSRVEHGDGANPYVHTYEAYRLSDAGRAALATLEG